MGLAGPKQPGQEDGMSVPQVMLFCAILLLARVMVRKFFLPNDGPTKESWSNFVVPAEGGVLTNLKKDDEGYIGLLLAKKIKITDDTYIFKFSFPDPEATFGMPIGNHVRFKATVNGETITRKYTPISDVLQKSTVDFVIKIYRANVHPKFPAGGAMTQHLESLKVGDKLFMQGPLGKLQYKGWGYFDILRQDFKHQKKQIGYIAGGTGITPCYNVLQSALRHSDKTQHKMIFGNRTVDDILLKDELNLLQQNHPDDFSLHLTVDIKPDAKANWTQGVGFVTKEMIKEHLPAPSNDTIILYCGPPIFTDLMEKHMEEMGYTADMMFKF